MYGPTIHTIGKNLIVNTVEFCKQGCISSNGYDCWCHQFKQPVGSSAVKFIGEDDCLAPHCWSINEMEKLSGISSVLEHFSTEVLITDANNIAGHTWRFVLKPGDDWEDVEIVGIQMDHSLWLVGSLNWYDLHNCEKQPTSEWTTWNVWRKLYADGFIY